MNYYELRSHVAKIVPRMVPLISRKKHQAAVQEKGRKSGYQEFKLKENKWVKQERLLNIEEINSFVEVSCRAAACPMPLNLDVWDGLTCPYNCKYCVDGSTLISMSNGETKPIRDIQIHDKVKGYINGEIIEDDVTFVFPIRKEKVMELKAGGESLRITDNHEVLTRDRGWVDAGDLTKKDFLLYFSDSLQYNQTYEHKRTHDQTQPNEESENGCESIQEDKEVVEGTSGSPSGFIETEERKNTTETKPRESFEIVSENETKQPNEKPFHNEEENKSSSQDNESRGVCSSEQRTEETRCQSQNVGPRTQSHEKSGNSQARVSKREKRPQQNVSRSKGIEQTIKENGIGIHSGKTLSSKEKGNSCGCLSPETSSGDRIRRVLDTSSTVGNKIRQEEGCLVKRKSRSNNSENFSESGIQRESLLSEDTRLSQNWIQIDNIEYPDEDPIDVYNFETQKSHNYFANGILVHNCFANAFRASLYTAFFDNSKTMGLRHCAPGSMFLSSFSSEEIRVTWTAAPPSFVERAFT